MVILNNLPAHEVAGVRATIEAAGARLLDLPPSAPDFTPIEQACAKLTALLRTAAARTVPDLQDAIRRAFTGFAARECRNTSPPPGTRTTWPLRQLQKL